MYYWYKLALFHMCCAFHMHQQHVLYNTVSYTLDEFFRSSVLCGPPARAFSHWWTATRSSWLFKAFGTTLRAAASSLFTSRAPLYSCSSHSSRTSSWTSSSRSCSWPTTTWRSALITVEYFLTRFHISDIMLWLHRICEAHAFVHIRVYCSGYLNNEQSIVSYAGVEDTAARVVDDVALHPRVPRGLALAPLPRGLAGRRLLGHGECTRSRPHRVLRASAPVAPPSAHSAAQLSALLLPLLPSRPVRHALPRLCPAFLTVALPHNATQSHRIAATHSAKYLQLFLASFSWHVLSHLIKYSPARTKGDACGYPAYTVHYSTCVSIVVCWWVFWPDVFEVQLANLTKGEYIPNLVHYKTIMILRLNESTPYGY